VPYQSEQGELNLIVEGSELPDFDAFDIFYCAKSKEQYVLFR